MKPPDDAGRFHSVQLRHHMVHKNNIVVKFSDFINGFFSACRRINVHFQRPQQSFRHGQIDRVIVHNQNLRIGGNEIVFASFPVIIVELGIFFIQYHGGRQRKKRLFHNMQIFHLILDRIQKLNEKNGRNLRIFFDKSFHVR